MNPLIVLTLFSTINYLSAEIKGFDDSILYSLNWPGSEHGLDLNGEFITVSSSHQENYHCYLPDVKEKQVDSNEVYEGPSPLGLLSPLFYSKLPCSYRLETYWTYEVCHGRHIRQYHEDREGKAYKLQEFYLGRWDKSVHLKLLQELQEKGSVDDDKDPVPTKKIDGNNLPYFEIVMGNGTLCDLNQNKPRQTNVIYVCYPHSKNEIYSLKETSICNYEIIVLTPLLCEHPKYKPAEVSQNLINCIPAEGNPNKPYNMIKMKEEARKLRKSSDIDHIRVEFVGLDLGDKDESPKPQETPTDTTPVENFLAGKNCLYGGTGWWKYEFCYGKSVEQYHIEKDGKKTSINLGLFDKQAHLDWLAKYPHKRPKPQAQRTQLSHLYSGGTICDKTGKARQTEVKLKCLENTSNLNAVSLYLLEPKYCEYILGVESPLICDILARADEDGLIASDVDLDFTIKDIPVM